jgi:DNA methylase N-4/N-6
MINNLLIGDCRNILPTLPEKLVQCVVTSPPYFRLRDYGVEGQIGLEDSVEDYVNSLVNVFREVKRILKDDGSLWLNLGDSYAGSGKNRNAKGIDYGIKEEYEDAHHKGRRRGIIKKTPLSGKLKHKDLIGVPWRVAFALQDDGWYLRQDIIWNKPNVMPEAVKDRCTKSHEYIFLLSKNKKYYFDYKAIQEKSVSYKDIFKNDSKVSAIHSKYNLRRDDKRDVIKHSHPQKRLNRKDSCYDITKRNKRDVWTVNTKPYTEAHFAVFPPALIQPCILAGSREGDIILDPFFGSGTVAEVAALFNRNWIGIDINEEYTPLYKKRLGLFAS